MNIKLQPQKAQKRSDNSESKRIRQSRSKRSQSPLKYSASQRLQAKYSNKNQYPHSNLTKTIIGVAIDIHKQLGPGFIEKIYQRAMYLEMKRRKIDFEREKKIEIYYNNANLGFEKVDFLIDNKVIVELKSVSDINDIHCAQLISYLKAANKKIGLILNFAKDKLEIKRIII